MGLPSSCLLHKVRRLVSHHRGQGALGQHQGQQQACGGVAEGTGHGADIGWGRDGVEVEPAARPPMHPSFRYQPNYPWPN
ncbi:hypothetical protein AZA_11213 [Nitrospirillum viridazoti Y2]|nr:hypothetical protein AZA_11213 [Nitrospirillum amazonense Y2]